MLLHTQYPAYRLEDRSVSLAALPRWVWVLMFVLLGAPIAVYLLLHGHFSTGWAWLGWTLIGVLAHEGLHAAAWKLASGLPWRAFTFGVQWKTATPYCHSTEPMTARAFRIGAISPLLFTGLLPWVVSLVIAHVDLALASAILISGAVGDLYVLWTVRDLPADVLVQDHDTQAGCIVLWPTTSGGPDQT